MLIRKLVLRLIVLGLYLINRQQQGGLPWTRSKALPQLLDKPLTRRELFSICGRLVGGVAADRM